jgi:transposase
MIQFEVKNKSFSEIKNRVRLNKTMFHVVQKDYVIGNVKGKLAICFNEQQRLDLNNSLYDEIMNAKLLLENKKTIKPGLEKYFSKSRKILTEKMEEKEEFHGYSCIFTTAKLTSEEMIHHYFEKDLVEKAFQSLNGVVRLRPIRHWLYNRVIAHVFICYLSYLLLSILKLRLKKINLSPTKALHELDSLYKIYMKDSKKGFEVTRVVALNKMQEKILNTVDKKLIQACSG